MCHLLAATSNVSLTILRPLGATTAAHVCLRQSSFILTVYTTLESEQRFESEGLQQRAQLLLSLPARTAETYTTQTA